MKKLIILGIFVLAIAACVPNEKVTDKVVKLETEYVMVDEDGYRYTSEISRFEYDGHKYIRFGNNNYQTIVHDPDCKCNKHNNNNNTLFDW